MDGKGCVSGFATDHVFLSGTNYVPGSCDANVALFVSCMTIISVLRIILALVHARDWIIRWRSSQDRNQGAPTSRPNVRRRRSRLPLFPSLSMISAISVTIFTILVATNVANASNGLPTFFLGLFYEPLFFVGLIQSRRIVTAGRKLIPLSTKTVQMDLENKGGMSQSTAKRLKMLEQDDWLLKVGFTAGIVASLVIFPPTMLVASLIVPSSSVPLQIGLTCLFIVDWSTGLSMAYQFQRLIRAITLIQEDQRSTFQAPLSRQDAVANAIRKMRATQITIILGCAPISIVWILTGSGAVLPRYWFSILFFGVELVAMATATITTSMRASQSGSSNKRSTTTNSREIMAADVTAVNSYTAPAGATTTNPSYIEPSIEG